MKYGTRYIYPTQYEYAGRNQHGDRYKQSGSPQVIVVTLSVTFDDAPNLALLIYLAATLKIPIKWNSSASPQTAEIEVVSVDALKAAGII